LICAPALPPGGPPRLVQGGGVLLPHQQHGGIPGQRHDAPAGPAGDAVLQTAGVRLAGALFAHLFQYPLLREQLRRLIGVVVRVEQRKVDLDHVVEGSGIAQRALQRRRFFDKAHGPVGEMHGGGAEIVAADEIHDLLPPLIRLRPGRNVSVAHAAAHDARPAAAEKRPGFDLYPAFALPLPVLYGGEDAQRGGGAQRVRRESAPHGLGVVLADIAQQTHAQLVAVISAGNRAVGIGIDGAAHGIHVHVREGAQHQPPDLGQGRVALVKSVPACRRIHIITPKLIS
jgi:hypothetical protein